MADPVARGERGEAMSLSIPRHMRSASLVIRIGAAYVGIGYGSYFFAYPLTDRTLGSQAGTPGTETTLIPPDYWPSDAYRVPGTLRYLRVQTSVTVAAFTHAPQGGSSFIAGNIYIVGQGCSLTAIQALTALINRTRRRQRAAMGQADPEDD